MRQLIFEIYSSFDKWLLGAGGSVHSEPLSGHVDQGRDQHVDQPDWAKSEGEWILNQSKR